MFSGKVIFFWSVYVTVAQCGSEDSTFKLMTSNLENPNLVTRDSVEKQKSATDNDDRNVNIPLLSLFNEMPMILPIDEDMREMPRDEINEKRIPHTASMVNIQHQEGIDTSKFLMSLLNSLESPNNEKQQLGKLNSSFESSPEIESIYKNFGKLIQPFNLLELDSFGNQFFNISSVNEPEGKAGEFYIVDLGRNDDKTMSTGKQIQPGIPAVEKAIPKNISISENEQLPSLYRIMGDFADSMKYMINSMRQTLSNLSLDNILHGKTYSIPEVESNLNISIYSHEETYFIPSNAYVKKHNPGLVNITWKSKMENFNNSLILKLSKDESGNIIFQKAHLSIMEGDGIHEYKLNEPMFVNTANGTTNGTIVMKLTERVGISFMSSLFQEVITVDMSENYANHWLVISIAALGLLVAGLIMLISYILHKKIQRYPRKGSLSKEAIIY